MKFKSTVWFFYPYQLATISFNTEESVCVYKHVKDVKIQRHLLKTDKTRKMIK